MLCDNMKLSHKCIIYSHNYIYNIIYIHVYEVAPVIITCRQPDRHPSRHGYLCQGQLCPSGGNEYN